MAPTTDALYDFTGKAVCGLPLFSAHFTTDNTAELGTGRAPVTKPGVDDIPAVASFALWSPTDRTGRRRRWPAGDQASA
jgi:hypothetical protein